jgi:ribosomal protein L11 methyltransferase
MANILAGPLIELAPVIAGCARPGADIVLSGLLEEQVEMVASAYADTCRLESVETREGWARVALQKT